MLLVNLGDFSCTLHHTSPTSNLAYHGANIARLRRLLRPIFALGCLRTEYHHFHY